MAWRTLRRLLEAAFKKTEKSKPFNQQRKPFALSWAWEHTLCLCYCSFKNKFFFCSSSHPLPLLHILCLSSGMCQEELEVCRAVLCLFLCTQM